jgi:hypothetical protein
MNLFIQIAFDLKDGKTPEYDAVAGWLQTAGLKRSLPGPDNTEVRLPANTFGAITNRFSSQTAAIDHLKAQFHMAAFWDACVGRALITASPAETTVHDIHEFSILPTTKR